MVVASVVIVTRTHSDLSADSPSHRKVPHTIDIETSCITGFNRIFSGFLSSQFSLSMAGSDIVPFGGYFGLKETPRKKLVWSNGKWGCAMYIHSYYSYIHYCI